MLTFFIFWLSGILVTFYLIVKLTLWESKQNSWREIKEHEWEIIRTFCLFSWLGLIGFFIIIGCIKLSEIDWDTTFLAKWMDKIFNK